MSEKLIYLPLGGAGEIGMNMYAYAYGNEGQERFILVDLGVGFPSPGQPGVDLLVADPKFITDRIDRLDGIFITHAHEDHIGALGLLFSRFNVPIYTRRFTGVVAHAKLEDRGHSADQLHIVQPWPVQVDCGPFKVGFLPVAHSIPEASGLVIDTPAGRIVHSGDFKLDKDPLVGEPFNEQMWSEIAKKGVHAFVCDSTNVFSNKDGRSESTLREPIAELVRQSEGMVVATTFASNIARLKTLAQAGTDADRSIVVLGRSMQRMLSYAISSGVLNDFPPLVDVEDAVHIPRSNLMVIVTGSQGETRAASAQLANGPFLGLSLGEGDTFLFSSKTIPGNEVSVGTIINKLAQLGVDVVDDSSEKYHVSGHANRPDLEYVHKLMKPKMIVPMHGEYRHLKEHKELAEANGIASIIAPNGTAIDLTGDTPQVLDHVETGRIYLDGSALIGEFDGVVLDRVRMSYRGHVSISLVIEDDAVLGVWAFPRGLAETLEYQTLAEAIEQEIEVELDGAKRNLLRDDDLVEELVERTTRRVVRHQLDKKPIVSVMVSRLES